MENNGNNGKPTKTPQKTTLKLIINASTDGTSSLTDDVTALGTLENIHSFTDENVLLLNFEWKHKYSNQQSAE